MAEFRGPHAERAQFQGQAVRPDDRRQPMDRRRGGERPVREAERLLRQGRHQDERLHAGDGRSAIRSGRRTRRTTGRCRRWATRVGWTYRKDWFNRPEIKTEFKTKYNRDLAPPKTWDEFKQVAEFFQNREIDGKKVYGAYIFTERGSEGITMGVTNVLYPFGFKYEDPKKPYVDERLREFGGFGEGAGVLQVALQVLHVARAHQRLHAGRARRLQVRPGGDDDELVRLLPGPVQGPERRRRQDRLLHQSVRERRRACSSAARAFPSSRPRPTATRRCSTSSGSPRPTCRRNGGRWAATRA